MSKALDKFFAGQAKKNLYWRPQYWIMSMLVVLEIARAISEVAAELRKTRLNLL